MQRAENKAVKKVLIVDDHKIMRAGLRSLLAKDARFECIGEADDGQEAVKIAKELRPDIVIMDIVMPNLDGIEATRQIKAELPGTEVIALSMYAARTYIFQVLQAGASGYLLKDSAFEELMTALVTVSNGGMHLSPAIMRSSDLKKEMTDFLSGNPARNERLTKRELQVLQLIADGRSTKDIAARLALSVKTVETHRKQIMDKLGIRSIAGLTKYCIREGLTPL
jgi:DNA-binding NarL/FixJ family response regulator